MPKKILFVEDTENFSKELERVFKNDNFFKEAEISIVATVDEALEKFQEQFKQENQSRFDLVVIDWHLMDKENGGLEVLSSSKPYCPKIKIVFTAHDSYENCVKAIKIGANDYIPKGKKGSIKKLIESAKQLLQARKYEKHEPESQWLRENMDELIEYKGELLAFIHGRIVAHAKSKNELLEKVKQSYPEEEPFIMYAPEII